MTLWRRLDWSRRGGILLEGFKKDILEDAGSEDPEIRVNLIKETDVLRVCIKE